MHVPPYMQKALMLAVHLPLTLRLLPCRYSDIHGMLPYSLVVVPTCSHGSGECIFQLTTVWPQRLALSLLHAAASALQLHTCNPGLRTIMLVTMLPSRSLYTGQTCSKGDHAGSITPAVGVVCLCCHRSAFLPVSKRCLSSLWI